MNTSTHDALRASLHAEVTSGNLDGDLRATVKVDDSVHALGWWDEGGSAWSEITLAEYTHPSTRTCVSCVVELLFCGGSGSVGLDGLASGLVEFSGARARVTELAAAMERGAIDEVFTSKVGQFRDQVAVRGELEKLSKFDKETGQVWKGGYERLRQQLEGVRWNLDNPEGRARLERVLAGLLVPNDLTSPAARAALEAGRDAVASAPGVVLVDWTGQTSRRTDAVLWDAIAAAYPSAGSLLCGPPVLAAWLERQHVVSDALAVDAVPRPEVLETLAALHAEGGAYTELSMALQAAEALTRDAT